MKSDKNSKQPVKYSLPPELRDIPVIEMLTPSEIEQLKQEKKVQNAYAKEAFTRLRPR